MPVLLVVGVLLAIYILRIFIGLFTNPPATLARLGSMVCNLLGILALTMFGFGVAYHLGWSDFDFGVGFIVGAGFAALVLFALSAWFARSRRRSEIRMIQRDYDAVARADHRRSRR